MRILIADDDIVQLKLMRNSLTRAGHEVSAFPDGDELLAAFEENPAPVVITDWLMPRLSGVELCKAIRAVPGVPYTYIAVVTTLSPSEHTLEAFECGVDEFIAKPIDVAVLSAKVAAAQRAMFRYEEVALRQALEKCQGTNGAEPVALAEVLGSMAALYRKQRAFTRCRAFLRRQLDLLQTQNQPAAIDRLNRELAELQAMEEGLETSAG